MKNRKDKGIAISVLTVISVLIVLGVVFAFVSLDNGELGVYDYVAYPKNISLGLDLKGGVYAVFEPKSNNETDLESRMQGTAAALEEMLFDKGYTEAVVSLENNNTRIRVEVPDVDDPEAIFTLIGKPASLEFCSSESESDPPTPANTYVTGKHVEKAYVTYDQQQGEYAVALEFDDEGAKLFEKATTDRLNKVLSIWIGGELEITPTVQSVISNGHTIITGGYTYEQANDLAMRIQSGAFDVELQMEESNTITATLGENSVRTSVLAGLIGLALIIVFLCVFYRLYGVAASMALLIYSTFYIFFLSIFPWVQLTLSGVAGVILSIGMAVDGNIVVFGRIRDEYRIGNADTVAADGTVVGKNMSVHSAIKLGFRKALPAIIDGNVTTLLGCIVMLFVGGSAIKSFAITLMIGVILSVLSTVFLTRVLVYSVYHLSNSRPQLFALPVAQQGGADHE